MPVFRGTPEEQVKAREAWDRGINWHNSEIVKQAETPQGIWESAFRRADINLMKEFGHSSEEYKQRIAKWLKENPEPPHDPSGMSVVPFPATENEDQE